MTHNEFLAAVIAVLLLGGGEAARRFLPTRTAYDAHFYRARDSLFFALSDAQRPPDTLRHVTRDSTARADTADRSLQEVAPPAPVGLIDVNRASAAELVRLPGIGPRLAQRIIAYRQEHGPFRHVSEMERVSGIGPRKLEALAPLVLVDP